MPRPEQERADKIDFVIKTAKHNGWTLQTPDIRGKLMKLVWRLYPRTSAPIQVSYAKAALAAWEAEEK